MENLGSMEIDQIYHLFLGSISCAVVLFVFIVVYVVIARRAKKTRLGSNLGSGGHSWSISPSGLGSPASLVGASATGVTSSASKETSPSADPAASPIDVGARLAGTGRDAWLEEPPSTAESVPPYGGASPGHAGKELLRVVRDSASGGFAVVIAGMRYKKMSDIRDRAVGERVLAAITHLLRFSDGVVASDQGMVILALPPCDAVEIPAAFGLLSEAREPDEVLRLVSDADHGGFCVHVADRCYHRIVEVDDQPTGQCILETITRLLQFSNGIIATNNGLDTLSVPPLSDDIFTPPPEPAVPESIASEAAPSSASGDSDVIVEPQAQPPSDTSPELLSEQERFLRELMSGSHAQQVEPQSKLERPGVLGGIRRMVNRTSDEALPTLNLAEEINLIFQSKLALSPLAKTDAQVEESLDGGVRIRVGTRYFSTPDDIPDAQLRELIKLSIAEWERS